MVMVTTTVDDVKNFAMRVERLCEFLLEGMKKDGSKDIVVLQKLKEDAANLQNSEIHSNDAIDGLANHMLGIPRT